MLSVCWSRSRKRGCHANCVTPCSLGPSLDSDTYDPPPSSQKSVTFISRKVAGEITNRRSQRYAQPYPGIKDKVHNLINATFSAISLSLAAIMVVFLSCLIACFTPNAQNYVSEGIGKPLVLPSCKFCNASIGGTGFEIVYEVRLLAI